MMKKIWIMALLAIMTVGTTAQAEEKAIPERHNMPAYRGLIEREQPNGYILRTFLRGDEHMHWAMTEDGWQIMEDKKGWLRYARLKKNGNAVRSCRKAHNAADRKRCEQRWLDKHGVKKI
ncbi:MAG: hypothetical protein IJ814_03550 [Paludibacteraceae bacterium]|nr:hypothetical protein [Paludibacteraceae bacterium]